MFAQISRNDPNAQAQALCGRSLAKLALTEREIKPIHVPMAVVVGDKDIVKNLYVEPLKKVRGDCPVVEIKDADHLTCIPRPQFGETIAAWLKKNSN
ncbi:MAG: hypothetical protein K8T25_20975 [Planctomycetia bacterium]|nr:hypothetical protein [Planctomycetia bacterium]